MILYFKFTIYNWLFPHTKAKLIEVLNQLDYKVTIVEQGVYQHMHIGTKKKELEQNDILALGILIGSITSHQ